MSVEATYVRNWAINLLFLWTRWGIAQIGFDRFAPCCLLPVSCNNGGKSRLRAPHRISAAACNTHSLTHTHTHTIASTRTHHLSVECVILYFRCSKFRTTTPRFFLSVDVSRVASPFVFFLLASAHFSFFLYFFIFYFTLALPPYSSTPASATFAGSAATRRNTELGRRSSFFPLCIFFRRFWTTSSTQLTQFLQLFLYRKLPTNRHTHTSVPPPPFGALPSSGQTRRPQPPVMHTYLFILECVFCRNLAEHYLIYLLSI